MGLNAKTKHNKNKSLYTIFTTAGFRKNYKRTYGINLRIHDNLIPLEPFPRLLRIYLDPKLSYKKHLENIESRIQSRHKLIRKIKGLKLGNTKNTRKLNFILFKCQIRSIFDYGFIILSTSTQQIESGIQKIQNRILKLIQFFPILTSTNEIHRFFEIDTVHLRTKKLFENFIAKRLNHEVITNEILEYEKNSYGSRSTKKFITPYHTILNYIH